MKKQSAFLSAALMVLTIALTAFFAAGCGGGDDDSGGGGTSSSVTVPKVGDLPAFPAGVNPAETEAAADSILAELEQSGLYRDVYDRMQEVVRDSRSGNNYNLKDLEDDSNTVKVNASSKITAKQSEGFAEKLDIEDGQVHYGASFNTNEYARYSMESKMKGKVMTDITSGNVTIAAGSTIEEQTSVSQDISVTKAGTIMEAKGKENASMKSQQISGFTLTTPLGDVKIISDLTRIRSHSVSNITIFDLIYNTEINENYTGSLKVYGKDNALLKTVTVTDYATYQQAQKLIGYHYSSGGYDD